LLFFFSFYIITAPFQGVFVVSFIQYEGLRPSLTDSAPAGLSGRWIYDKLFHLIFIVMHRLRAIYIRFSCYERRTASVVMGQCHLGSVLVIT
jgi:hypothetical protein